MIDVPIWEDGEEYVPPGSPVTIIFMKVSGHEQLKETEGIAWPSHLYWECLVLRHHPLHENTYERIGTLSLAPGTETFQLQN